MYFTRNIRKYLLLIIISFFAMPAVWAQQGGFEQFDPLVDIISAPPNNFPMGSNTNFSGPPDFSGYSCSLDFSVLFVHAFGLKQETSFFADPEGPEIGKTTILDSSQPENTTPATTVNRRAFPVGDLNGDGCDELAVLDNDVADTDQRKGGIFLFPPGFNSREEFLSYLDAIQQDQVPQEQQTPFELPGPDDMFDFFGGFEDLDGDGLDDAIFGAETQAMSNFWTFHSSPSDVALDIVVHELNPMMKTAAQNEEFFRFNAADIDGDGDSEVIVFSTTTNPDFTHSGRLRVFDINAQRESTLIQDIALSGNFGTSANRFSFYALDIDGASEPNPIELLLVPQGFFGFNNQSITETLIIDADPQTGEFMPDALTFVERFVTPVGDLNNDGRHDFLIGYEEGKPYIAYGPADLSTGLSMDVELPAGDDPDFTFVGIFAQPKYIRAGTYGDLNGDGIDDAIIPHIENTTIKIGRRFVYGSADGNLSSEFGLYDRNVFFNTFASSANVGDVNGDGFEDFAIVRDDEYQVDIFFGREVLSLAPDVVLQADRSRTKPVQVISGDFNGDGYSDIAIKVSKGIATDVYFGGPDMNGEPDHRFDPASAQTITDPESNQIDPANIGDVNGDGIDDFLINSGFAQDDAGNFLNQAWIFYGGSTLSSGPDLTIDYNDDPNLSGSFRNVAADVAVGDFNGDGVNDLALEMGTIVTDGFVTGGAYLYWGDATEKAKTATVDFSAPNLILRPTFQDVTNKAGRQVAAGDFDGDGISDLAMGITESNPDSAESPVIQIFKGGVAMDDSADVELTAPADAFGGDTGVFFNSVLGFMEFLPDDDGDGIQNLLMATTGGFNNGTNAAIYAGGAVPNSIPAQVLVAPNPTIGLGGNRSVAAGDFNNDGNNDILPVQQFDLRDAFRSSRAYMYSPNVNNIPVPIEEEIGVPEQFFLSQNFPNPFNPSTNINFELSHTAEVTLKVYDILGREVATLVNERLTAGAKTVAFDASALSSGIYIYRLVAGSFAQTRKMTLIK